MNSSPSILTRHPLSSAFPDMADDQFAELVIDIKANGLLQAVVTLDGAVLDGWHRYRASIEAGVNPTFEEFSGPDPVAFVLSLNMHRRHLTGSQRAEAVVACRSWAKPGHQAKVEPGSTLEEMAEAAGVSKKTIQQAKAAHEAGLGDAVRDGKVSAKQAAEVAKLPEEERQAAIEAPKEEKPKATPKAEDPAELDRLKAENEDQKERLEEMAHLMQGLQEELEAARRILDSEDLLAQFNKEVKRAQAMAHTVQSRNNGLMDENSDLKGRLKSALRKIERLEKAAKEVAA